MLNGIIGNTNFHIGLLVLVSATPPTIYRRRSSVIRISLFQNFANKGVLTDVTLVCDGKELKAHKVLLAAASDYFSAMFTGGMLEADMDRVEIQGVDAVALELLVDYCYTGTPFLTAN